MTKSIRLNDLQLILLSNALQRDDGSLWPLPSNLANDTDRVPRAIASLMKRLLIQEAAVSDRRLSWRDEGEQPIGLFITDAGRKLLAADAPDEGDPAEPVVSTQKTAMGEPQRGSKSEQVLEMLRRPGGATMVEMVAATGWLPHSTRAALTGLRKKGHPIARGKRGDLTCYSVEVAA